MADAQKLLTPEEIAARAGGDIPFLRLPDRASVFADRARRLRQLAGGHSMSEYLRFIAEVADVQQSHVDASSSAGLPDSAAVEQCHEHGMPPLNAQTHQRDRIWCDLLRRMLRELAGQTEGKSREVIIRLEGERDALYEAQASKLLNGVAFGLDTATAPLISAALQVYWTGMSARLGLAAFRRLDVPNLCPCCGSRPTASIARIGAAESGHRYLHCSLCAAEWHLVRIKCSACDSTKGIHYQSIADGRPSNRHAVKAECCDECGSYLKIMYMDRDQLVDPVADDLATMALDLLVVETGKTAAGVNFMLIHGDPDVA